MSTTICIRDYIGEYILEYIRGTYVVPEVIHRYPPLVPEYPSLIVYSRSIGILGDTWGVLRVFWRTT